MKWALALLLATGCAHPPPTPAAELAPLPPRGEPPPRLGEIPSPPPNNGGPQTVDTPEQRERFGELQGQAYKEQGQREARAREASAQAVGAAERRDVQPAVEACNEVPPRDRAGCPIATAAVEKVADLPGGARLLMKPGLSPAAINRAAACQKALAVASQTVQPLCPFLDAETNVAAHRQGKRAVVDLTGGDVPTLRARVRAAFAR
jgi:hypothetical protein